MARVVLDVNIIVSGFFRENKRRSLPLNIGKMAM